MQQRTTQIKKNVFAISFVLFASHLLYAQPTSINRNRDPYKWMIGVSWNVVNDNEEKLPNLYDVSKSWNYVYFPSRLAVDRYLKRGWSWEAIGAYNNYTSSKIINDSTGRTGIFLSGDFHIKYSYNHLLKKNKWFDPYYSFGLGFTYRKALSKPLTPTFNAAFGSNFWFAKQWGAQVQITGKLALVPDIYVSRYDYFQYNVGVVYRKNATKRRPNTHKKRYGWTKDKQRFKRKNT